MYIVKINNDDEAKLWRHLHRNKKKENKKKTHTRLGRLSAEESEIVRNCVPICGSRIHKTNE